MLDVSRNQLTALPTSITQLKHLQQLALDHNNLTVLPESIGNLEKLTMLNVSNNQLTALPTSITQLKQLEELYLAGNTLTVLPVRIGNLEKLTMLDVGNNQLTALPKSSTQLIQLRLLYLAGNRLTVLPESIGNLEKLTILNVSWNQLTALPTSIKQLKQLQELYLAGNKLTVLPESIGHLEKLTMLDLSTNQLTALPTSITQLKQLKELDLDHNKLTVLPESIGNLQKLTMLNVSWNQLTALPTSITQLKQLQKLYLANNKLTVLPECIGHLEKLTELVASWNQLTALPKSSTQLIQLQVLYLAGNRLTVLPKSIGNLEKLTTLDVSRNQLTALTTSITQLKQLQELDLEHNKLTVLPESIGNLEKLTMLVMSWNQLTALPTSITQLKQLQKLNLDHNNLTVLPESIGNLEKLTMVNVSWNQLTKLPTSITQLKQLKELYLAGNTLTVLPESIGNLQELTMLNVSNNHLTALPTNITQLKQLQELYLAGNKLTVLPESIGNLQKLTMLNVSWNQLTALPSSITQLKQLQELYLAGNKVTVLPESIGHLKKLTMLDLLSNQLPAGLTEGEVFRKLREAVPADCTTFTPKAVTEPLKKDRKTNSWRIKLNEEGVLWKLTEAAAFITFPPKAVTKPMEITCSLWSPRTCSPPLDENEALVSNVIELSCDGPPSLELSRDFNEGVTLALSHSATGLKGYEVVMQQLMDPETNKWKDLKTKNTGMESGIQGDTLIRTDSSGLLFPLAEAKVIQCSSFAVIWRLKSFTFSSTTTSLADHDPEFTYIVPEYPDVSVSIPRSDLPESGDFSLTIKVQEVPCDEVKDDEVLAGPILHISSSPDVQFFEPVTITIPFTLQKAKKEVLDLSSGHLRILFFTCGSKYPEWTEITDDLDTPPDVKDGVVTFQVKHFSKFSTEVSKRKRKLTSSELQHFGKKVKMLPQEAGFLACLCETGSPGRKLLTLWCFPLQMQPRVENHITSRYRVHHQGEGNSLKPLCKDDATFISDLEALTPLQDRDFKKFPLRFLGDYWSKSQDLLVLVEEKNVPKVTLNKVQQEDELVCELVIIPTFQAASNTASSSQEQSNVASSSQPQINIPSTSQAQINVPSSSDRKLKVTLLADEWGSSKGGLSTMNRVLAMQLAKHTRVEVTFLLPHCSDQGKEDARRHSISIVKAEEKVGFEPQDWLIFPPKDLAIDIVIGHSVKLGRQVQIIRDSHKCKWVQVVHTAPEELGMFKSYSDAISKAEEKHQTEVDLCKRADLVVAIGPKLTEAVSCYLRSCGKDQDVFSLTPGIFNEFFDVKQAFQDRGKFRVLVFGRGEPKDFQVKGFDIAAKAVAELKDKAYQLLFVGAPEGKQEEVANSLIQFIPKDQLIVRGYVQGRQKLKDLFCEVDLAIMPSRTEGFGLTALEALSAGLPVLVSTNSGFGQALKKVPSGSSCVVESEDVSVWAKAIRSVRMKERDLRLEEVTILRKLYEVKYSWKEQCERLVKKMLTLTDDSS